MWNPNNKVWVLSIVNKLMVCLHNFSILSVCLETKKIWKSLPPRSFSSTFLLHRPQLWSWPLCCFGAQDRCVTPPVSHRPFPLPQDTYLAAHSFVWHSGLLWKTFWEFSSALKSSLKASEGFWSRLKWTVPDGCCIQYQNIYHSVSWGGRVQ